MPIVNAEPLRILLQVDCDLVLIALPIEAFMSDGCI
jgi:hypothetical protein